MLPLRGGPCLSSGKEFGRASFNGRVVPTVSFQLPYSDIYKHPNFARALVRTTFVWEQDGSDYIEFGIAHRYAADMSTLGPINDSCRFIRVKPFPNVDEVTLAQVSWFSWNHHRTTFDAAIVHGLERRDGDQFVELENIHNVSLTLNRVENATNGPT